MPHDEKICEKICRFHVLWLTLHRNWDDESWLRGLSYGVMVALQFLVLPVEVRILVRQLTQSGNLQKQVSRFVFVPAPLLVSGQSENTVVQFFRDKHDEYGLFCRLLSFALNQGSGSGAAELCLTSAWSDRQGAKPEDIQPHTSTASEMPNKRQTELVRHLRSRFDKFAIPVRKFRVRRTLHMRLSRVWQLRSHHYICSQPYFRRGCIKNIISMWQ